MLTFEYNKDWDLIQNFMEWWRINTLEAYTFNDEPLKETEAARRFCQLYEVGSVEEILERYNKVIDNPIK